MIARRSHWMRVVISALLPTLTSAGGGSHREVQISPTGTMHELTGGAAIFPKAVMRSAHTQGSDAAAADSKDDPEDERGHASAGVFGQGKNDQAFAPDYSKPDMQATEGSAFAVQLDRATEVIAEDRTVAFPIARNTTAALISAMQAFHANQSDELEIVLHAALHDLHNEKGGGEEANSAMLLALHSVINGSEDGEAAMRISTADLVFRGLDILMGLAATIPEDLPYACICDNEGLCAGDAGGTTCWGRPGTGNSGAHHTTGNLTSISWIIVAGVAWIMALAPNDGKW